MKNIFIFQSNVEKYDLRQKLLEGERDTWYATRFRTEMHIGDIVLFWMAGPDLVRGLYGYGKIISRPYIQENWDKYGIDVFYERRLAPLISASEIKEDQILSHMAIFTLRVGTNFLLSALESDAVISFLERKGEDLARLEVR